MLIVCSAAGLVRNFDDFSVKNMVSFLLLRKFHDFQIQWSQFLHSWAGTWCTNVKILHHECKKSTVVGTSVYFKVLTDYTIFCPQKISRLRRDIFRSLYDKYTGDFGDFVHVSAAGENFSIWTLVLQDFGPENIIQSRNSSSQIIIFLVSRSWIIINIIIIIIKKNTVRVIQKHN